MFDRRRTTTFLIFSMIAWGSVYPVSKYLMTETDPMVVGFLRYFTAVITMAPFFIMDIGKNSKKISGRNLLQLTAAGLTGTTVFAFFLYAGVARSTASIGSIIINTQPLFAALLAPLLLKESNSRSQIIGVFVGFTGMFLVVTGGEFKSLAGGSSMLTGNILLIFGAISMCLYGIIIKKPAKELGGITATWLSMAIGTLALFLVNFILTDDFITQATSFKGRDLLLVVYLGSIATAAAYLLFTLALTKINVVTATAFKFLVPVSGVSLSIIFLGERPALLVYAGIFIVIFSVFLIQRAPVRLSAEQETT